MRSCLIENLNQIGQLEAELWIFERPKWISFENFLPIDESSYNFEIHVEGSRDPALQDASWTVFLS